MVYGWLHTGYAIAEHDMGQGIAEGCCMFPTLSAEW
jgi:hypothetical protein